MSKILFKYPSRSRPLKFFASLDNIQRLAKHDDYQILCSFDIDDPTMCNDEVKKKMESYPNAKAYWGFSGTKVAAINRDMDFADPWDICIVMADDMIWVYDGFDLKIIELFEKHFPDFDGLLHIPDGVVNERLCTMHIVGRKYYDRFGYLYHPSYGAVFCDNENMDVAKVLGKYVYESVSMFRHLHPIWSLAPMDDLYRKNEDPINYAKDGELYRQRKAINFGL